MQVLDRVAAERGFPRSIACDHGAEFAGKALDLWAHQRGVALQFIRPGKPVDNAFVESFNGKLRDECLSIHWFHSVRDAQYIVDAWRRDFNTFRPHRSLAQLTPQNLVRRPRSMPYSPQRLTA